ncbi:MAG: undecaprenyl-diphosphate phosphatase [Candidatus Bathyarchaeia archaeon]
MDKLIKSIILGLIQGLTEWLPISSTGHLRIAENLIGLNVPLLFDVILHVGTLLVVASFFKSEVTGILSALARLDFKSNHGRLIPLIIVGTVPTVLIGLIFSIFFESAFENLLLIAYAFLACGVFLYLSKAGREKTGEISGVDALIIGIAQGIAVIPGISRSGATISAALMLGISREKAFKFSFLLSIPAVIASLGLTFYTHFNELLSLGFGLIEILSGAFMAVLVGYLALKILWKTIVKKKFHFFAFYCWVLSVLLIVFSLGFF